MATQVQICNLALRRIGANTITTISDGSKEADHCSDFWTYVIDEVLDEIPWGFSKETRRLDYMAGFGFIDEDTDKKTITGITKADGAVVTCTSHGMSTGFHVYIDDCGGMTEINDAVYFVTRDDANTVTLTGTDSTLFTTYTSGGYMIRKEPNPKYSNGYTYDIPANLQVTIDLVCGTDFEVMGPSTGNPGSYPRLLTTARDAVLNYVTAETTTTNWSNRFISVLAYRLAAELALPLSKKGGKHEKMMQLYEYQIGKRAKHEANFVKKVLGEDDPWTDAGGFTV